MVMEHSMEKGKMLHTQLTTAWKRSSRAGTSKTWRSLSIPLTILTAGVKKPSSASETEFVAILEALWAIVLREHTALAEVSYGRFTEDGNDEDASCISLVISTDESAVSPSLSSVVTARLDGARSPFVTRDRGEASRCETAFLITHTADRGASLPSLGQEGHKIVIQVDGSTPANPLSATFWYRSPEVNDMEAHNLASTLKQAMYCLSSEPHKSINDLVLLSPEHKEQLRKWMPRIDSPLDSASSVLDILGASVQMCPGKHAVESWDESWTYHELERISQSLALHLREADVECGDAVLLLTEKSAWAVASITAILMAGAVCVPVDIRQPRERLQQIVECSSAKFILISESEAMKRVEWGVMKSLQIIRIPASLSALRPTTKAQLPVILPGMTAFNFFTSGSTGVPKCVAQSHQALAMTAKQITTAMQMEESSTTFQYSSYSFDVSIGDIFATFSAGGCLFVPSEQQRLDELSNVLNTSRASHICITSTVLANLVPEEVPLLAKIVVGGESPTKEQLNAWYPRISTIYGTTESVIWDTYHARHSPDSSPTNIGRAMGSTTTWIADIYTATRLVPIGAVGELLIGGPQLSQGYLNGDRKADEAFLEKPSWLEEFLEADEPGRLYRTGDLVQYDANGDLHYLGRKDRQIKLSGQRVELGDIEFALRQSLQEGTLCAAEIVRPDIYQGREMLAAFIAVNDSDLELSLQRSRSKLAAMLPMYMIPSLFIPLSGGIPVTPTGKVDRAELRRIGSSLSQAQLLGYNDGRGADANPATKNERVLFRILQETLDLQADLADMNTNFFQLGGTSIYAIKVVALARKLGFSLSVMDMFENPCLRDMAAALRPIDRTSNGQSATTAAPFSLLGQSIDKVRAREVAAFHCGVEPSQVQDLFPCSAFQQGLLALSLKNDGDYIQQAVMELPSGVDAETFRAAYERTAKRIDLLRCRAIVLPHGDHNVHLAVIDEPQQWFTGDDLEQSCASDHHDVSSRGMGERLVQCTVIEQPEGRPYFVWTLHHALFDGWSMSIMMNEIHNQLSGHTESPLVPFQNFLRYVQNEVDEQACSRFWRSNLDGAGHLQFPHAVSASRRSHGGKRSSLRRAIGGLKWPKTGVTPSAIIQGAWSLLLARQTSTYDVVFGSTVIGRHAAMPGVEHVTGPVIATIPRRIRVDPEQKISKYLMNLQLDTARTVPYEQLGLAKIARVSDDAQRACEFQTLLVVQPPDEATDLASDISERGRWEVSGAVNTYALMLQCWLKHSGSVEFEMEFDETVTDLVECERLLTQLEWIVQQLCTDSDNTGKVDDVLHGNHADLALLTSWNEKVRCKPTPSILAMIQRQVINVPDRLAVEAWDGSVTYEQLWTSTDQLAQQLHVDTEKPRVIICLDKSYLAVIASIAVLKAGGVCVFMEPGSPRTRQKAIIEISQASFAITDQRNSRLLSQWIATTVLPCGTETSANAAVGRVIQYQAPTAEACLYFTSGSTGIPKAVSWDHTAISTTAVGVGERFCFSQNSRVYQFCSYVFDVSFHETLATLINGGCLCVPSDQSRHDMLQSSIAAFNANTITLTPSVAQLLEPGHLQCLETVILAGEPIPPQLARRWQEHVVLYNWYGPTECSLAATCRVGTTWQSGNVGSGTTTMTWIVHPEDHDILQPIGAVGELLLQGPCVATGYADDPERTAQSFVEPPQWSQRCQVAATGGLLYKTGDLARYASDGSIIILGRKDTQVKIRGQRVELGEVEVQVQAVLPHNTAVAVEMVRAKGSYENPVLVAFIQLHEPDRSVKEGTRPASSEWTEATKAQLSDALPRHMVPNIFFFVQSFPYTATGKLDRRKLSELGASSLSKQLSEETVIHQEAWQPTSEAEAILGQSWMEVLGVSQEKLAQNAHFVRLGGNSIDAMRLASAVTTSGYSLSVRDILTSPLLANQAAEMQLQSSKAGYCPTTPFSLLDETMTEMQARHSAASQCDVRPDQIEDVLPCTALQTALLAQTSRSSGDYICRYVYDIEVPLDLFKAAWEAVVAENPILRTRIVDLMTGNLYQAVIDKDLLWNDGCQTVDDYIHGDQGLTMDIGIPLVRWGIVASDPSSSFNFIWTIHHSLFDGWSLQAILKQVDQAYAGQSLGPVAPFRDFVRYVARSNKSTAAKAFWERKLDGAAAPQFPILPSMRHRPRATSTTEGRMSLPLPSVREDGNNVTLNTIIRVAWALVLARYSQSADVVFGATVLGRQADVPGICDMVGPTIATVPVRIRWSDSDTVQSVLSAAQLDSIETTPYEQVGLQWIRQLSPSAGEACKFQSTLIVQPPRQETPSPQEGHSLFDNFTGEESYGTFSSTALMLRCAPPSEKDMSDIRVNLDYDPQVVNEAQAQRLLHQMEHTLREMSSSSPTTRIGQLKLLSDADQHQLLRWNDKLPEGVEATVNQLFHDVVQKYPTTQAVHAWDADLTYEQLDSYSNDVANHLASLELSSKQMVPLYFEKSAWTIVAIFGVIKAGGTVVLLEPSQPDHRLQMILKLIDAKLIVTSARNHHAASLLAPTLDIFVVSACSSISPGPTKMSCRPEVQPCWPVYVVFTSGSTGVPKGVVITHGNVCSARKHRQPMLPYKPGDRVLDGVSYAFDVSWGNILFTLCSGACLCVPSAADDLDTSLRRYQVTIAGIVPSVARLLRIDDYPALKAITLGGESSHAGDVRQWEQKVKMFNSYGPAECTVSVGLALLNGDDRVHIGRGMGSRLWIVDDTQNCLASIGAVGELWLEGPQVGLGYLNDARTSAAAFHDGKPMWMPSSAADSYQITESSRFYRTGDLAQHLPDGMIRVVGRRDTQAKLRGQRIELGEVEQFAKRYLPEGTATAAEVVCSHTAPDRQFLVAFVAPDPWNGLTPDETLDRQAELRANIAAQLPSFMCPSAYIGLPSLPCLVSGKVDRGQLRKLGSALSVEDLTRSMLQRSTSERSLVLPSNEREEKLRELWAATLRLSERTISVEDSFLQLQGGDSISVMRLVRLGQERSMHFSVADVFTYPKLRDLAQKVTSGEAVPEMILPFSLSTARWTVERLRSEAATRCGVRMEQVQDIFPSTALQEGLLAVSSRSSTMYVSRQVYELHESTDPSRLRAAWDRIVALLPILRTRVVDLHPHGLHQVVVDEPITWGEEEEGQNSYGLGDRLAHWTLIDDSHSRRLIWNIHHALYDAPTILYILEHVERAYYGESFQPHLPLQPFVRYLSTIDAEACRKFWKSQLLEVPDPSFPVLPSGSHTAKADQSCACIIPDFEWPTTINVTPSTWVRVAWAILVGKLANSDDVTFGATVSGRQIPLVGIQDVVGPTISTVPIRVALNWTTSIADFASQLQNQATSMMEFEQIGLHHLRQINQDTKRGTQFKTLLDIQAAKAQQIPSRLWTRKDGEAQGRFDDFPLIIDCELGKTNISISMNYDPSILTARQAERLMHQFQAILLQLDGRSLDFNKSIVDLEATSQEDIAEIWHWNATVPEEIFASVHETIQSHVQSHPHGLAVDSWDGQLSYKILDRYSTILASHLQQDHAHELQPGTVVALCFEKSMWTVVAALAVMKVGAGFTLMDSSQPEERLRTIASQVNKAVILSSSINENLASRLAEQVIVVDSDNLLKWSSPRTLNIHGSPASILYVVFTSGSTGTPKGAMITHANFSSAFKHQAAFLGYNEETRVYDFASYSFDIALSNMLHCLMAGGCLCIPSDSQRRSSQLAESMRQMQVNLVDLTPSVARTLDPKDIPSLKTLALGGESALRSDIQKWAPYVRVLNGIGQAECTVTTTMGVMDPTVQGAPSLGRSLGTNTWIVNPQDHQRLSAIGAVGELLVEGPLVGIGYLNDETKTSASFIRNPRWLSDASIAGTKARSARMYKTGDLVRYNTSGELLFVGRKDAQTKIRGQRIELEEVEYHVHRSLKHWAPQAKIVAESASLSSASITSQVLIAFVCISNDGDSAGSENRLRIMSASTFPVEHRLKVHAQLEHELPSAMIPFVYVPVSHIPLAPTGKADRRRLKALAASLSADDLGQLRGVERGPKRDPTTATERELVDLSAEILNIPTENIGIGDNFVQLGGDSISAMRLTSLAKRKMLKLDIAILLSPTSSLSDVAEAAAKKPVLEATPAGLPPFAQLATDDVEGFCLSHIRPHLHHDTAEIEDAYPVTEFQKTCITAALQEKPMFWNYFYCDINATHMTASKIEDACRAVAMHFPILRTVFVPFDDSYLQIVMKDWLPEIVNLDCDVDEMEKVCFEDWRSCHVKLGTHFVRLMFLQQKDSSTRLILRLSHALYDGMSLSLLLEGLAAAIDNRPLPATGSFASFINHTVPKSNDSIRYWSHLLSESSITQFPPTSHTFSAGNPYTVRNRASWKTALPSGITPATFCTSCWAAVIATNTQNHDIVIGRLVSGQGSVVDSIPEAIAGPCLNVVPLRATWPAQSNHNNVENFAPPRDVVSSIQNQQLQGLPHEATGLTQITASCTDWPRDTKFDSVFQFQNIDEETEIRLSGGTSIRFDVLPMEFRPEQIWVLVKPLGQQQEVEVVLFGHTGIMMESEAMKLVDQLCELIGRGLE